MPTTKVSSGWNNGNLEFYDVSGNVIAYLDGTNRKLVIPSGSNLTADALNLDTTELGLLDGATAGSITASKIVTRDAAKAVPLDVVALAAAGNSQGTAAALAGQVTAVTGADNTVAVRLPTAVIGQAYIVINTVANRTLPVYPATGAQINGGGANAAFTLGPGQMGIFVCAALLTWYVAGHAASTPTTTEMALLAGAGAGGTPVAGKAQIADANQNIGVVKATALHIGTSGSETQVTATAAELNTLDRTGAAGVAEASKAVVLDANAHLDAVKTAALSIGATGAEVAVTATPAELNALAGAASGLGSSNTYVKTDAGVKTLVAAHATKDRGVLVVVTINETFATVGGAGNEQPVVKLGEADTDDKCFGVTALVDAAAGARFIYGFTNLATKAIIATLTAANGNGTGGFSVLVMALPNS